MGDSGGPSLERQYSAKSNDALEKLGLFESLLAEKEQRFAEMVTAISSKQPELEECIKFKNELAIMVGEIDKLQMNGIDTVMVGGLNTGQEDAKGNRKNLNKRAHLLTDRVKELHASLVKHVNQQKL